ncbi:hypothetical protein [Rhizobium sp. FY34]|uniref:hypothetical protein n=1 Tax=Rhizobium sp. FY34 TaxID=2562309 RepID=UPI0010C0AF0B|nr:hypothetical protein [Rhizobium sp. FY34]
MHASSLRLSVALIALLTLSGFRMASGERQSDPQLLYDVRGAFVSARPDVSRRLVADTDRLVDDAIRATFRQKSLPRTVLTIRIVETGYLPLILGGRFRAKVTVEATAVGNGEKIATGTFAVSTFALDQAYADRILALRIAERVSMEFRLQDAGPSTLATALFP